jgi:N-carbamoylputrescine amidase
MLIPHSYSIPAAPTKDVSEKDIARMKNNLLEMAPYYSRLLGIPAVSVNKCGPARAPKPDGYLFPGLTTIVDSDGTIQAQMEEQEGVVIADVRLDPAKKIRGKPRAYGRYVYAGPPGRGLFVVIERVGQLWYTFSRDRQASAQAASMIRPQEISRTSYR